MDYIHKLTQLRNNRKPYFEIDEEILIDAPDGYVEDIILDIELGVYNLVDDTIYLGYVYKTQYNEEADFWWTEEQIKKKYQSCSWDDCEWRPNK